MSDRPYPSGWQRKASSTQSVPTLANGDMLRGFTATSSKIECRDEGIGLAGELDVDTVRLRNALFCVFNSNYLNNVGYKGYVQRITTNELVRRRLARPGYL